MLGRRRRGKDGPKHDLVDWLHEALVASVVEAGSLIDVKLFGIDTRGIFELLENSSIRGNTISGGLPTNFGRPGS